MSDIKYTVHGIDCTTGEKTAKVYYDYFEAMESFEDWIGWFNYYQPKRKFNGSEADFYIECDA